MAVEKTIDIKANTGKAEKNVNNLADSVQNVADATQEVNEEVKDIGKSSKAAAKGVKNIERGFKGVGVAIKAAGIGLALEAFQLFKDVLQSNQGVADSFAVSMQALVFAFNGIIQAVADSRWSDIPKVLGSSLKQAREFVALQNEARIAEAERLKVQMESQLMAEKARQFRDEERNTIEERIEANELLNEILMSQLEIEEESAEKALRVAQLEYERNKNNENYIALLQAETELLDVQERITGQRSEQLMNQMSLQRELLDLQNLISEGAIEQYQIEEQARIDAMGNEKQRLLEQQELNENLWIANLQRLYEQLDEATEGTVAYQEILNQIGVLNAEFNADTMQNERDLADLRRENIKENLDLTASGFGALISLNEAFAKDDEENAEKAFKRTKALQIAQAIANTASAVTAQLAVPQDAIGGTNFIKAGIALATGLAQVETIRRTEFGGAGSLNSSIETPSAPANFNVVGGTGNQALARDLSAALGESPLRAYVVGSEVTSQQSLDRNRVNQISFP